MAEYCYTTHPTKLKKNGEGQSCSVHRLVWEQHNGKIPEGYMIHHINGDKKDNRIENLMMVTPKEHGKLHRKPNRKRVYYPSGAVKIIKVTGEEG